MADKGGLGTIQILPQQLLATKEENPRKFFAQIVYMFFWIGLLILTIVYSAYALAELLESQDNPVITLSISSEDKLNYPVFIVCPFQPIAIEKTDSFSYFAYGLFPDQQVFQVPQADGWWNPQSAAIDKGAGLANPKKGSNSDNIDLPVGNTGSIFPARRDCDGGYAVPDKKKRQKLAKEQVEITTNMFSVAFRSKVDLKQIIETSRPGNGNPDKDTDKKKAKVTPYYYPCIIFNADRAPTDKDFERWRNPFSDSGNDDCQKIQHVEKLLDKKEQQVRKQLKKKKSNDISFKQAYATDVGYYDGYVMKIKTYWRYEADPSKTDYLYPDSWTVTSLSVTLAESLDNVRSTAAEYASLAVTVGTRVVIFIRKIEFKCADCEDDEKVTFFNATVNLIDLAFFPEVPYRNDSGNLELDVTYESIEMYQKKDKTARQLGLWNNEVMVQTWIQVFFEAMEVTQQEEIYTTSVLDFLGNVAGMAGTLLSFAIINTLDRFLSYAFIQNGAKASVWDD